jgi:hypothetical protein
MLQALIEIPFSVGIPMSCAFLLLCAYKTMLQALIEITFSIGTPMSCASFFLVMCIQNYASYNR